MRTKKRLLSLLLCGALLFSGLPATAFAENGNGSGQTAGGLCEHHPEHTKECGYTEGAPCSHEHDEGCFALVTECVHEHTTDCYPAADSVSDNTATPSNADGAEPSDCTHECSEESGCITKELDCKHEHDADCGYTEAAPCAFVCEICNPTDTMDSGENKPDGVSGNTIPAPAEPEECICETVCTVEEVNTDCPVCGIEGADLTLCEGEAETATPSDAEDPAVGKVQAMIDALPTADGLAAMSKEEQQAVYAGLQAAYDAYEALTDEQKAAITGAEVFDTLFEVFNGMVNALDTTHNISTGSLTISQNGSYTVTGTTIGNRIIVNSGVTATVTLNGVNITGVQGNLVTETPPQSPIDLADGATLTLILAEGSTNTLTGSTEIYYNGAPGIHVPDNAALIIQGSGSLSVTGGSSGTGFGAPGIGGTTDNSGAGYYRGEDCGTVIVLTGNVTAAGGDGSGSSHGVDIGGGSGTQNGDNGQGIRPVSDQENTYTVWGELTLPEGVEIPEGAVLTGDGSLSPKLEQSAPNAPTLNTQTSTSVTLNAPVDTVQGRTVEYGYTTGNQEAAAINNWTSNATFNDLVPGTAYIFYARYAENNFYEASEPSDPGLTVETSKKDSKVAVSVTGNGVVNTDNGYSTSYGSTVTLTATISEAANINVLAVAQNRVEFFVGTEDNKTSLGTADVSEHSATKQITLSGDTWKPGTYIITAEYGGSSTMTDSVGTTTLTVNPIPISKPDNLTFSSGNPGEATATWNAVENADRYLVKLYKDGVAYGESVSTQNTYTFPIIEAGSYTFTVTAKGEGNYADSQESSQSEAVTFYAVSFDTDSGTSINPQVIVEGGKVTKPDDPVKENHTFEGWYNGDNKWKFDTDTVTEETTLTAKWTEHSYSISVDLSELDFGSKKYDEAVPDARTVTITNTGNQSITLNQPTAEHFEIGTLSAATLAPNGEATFTVQPKDNLRVGSYEDAISISGSSGVSGSVKARFTVDPARLSTPSNLTLSSGNPGEATATWNAVENADRYLVKLYKDGAAYGERVSTQNTYTFPIIEAGSYTFTVTAEGKDNYTNSQESATSGALHTVTFNDNGATSNGNITMQLVENGGKATEPTPQPEKGTLDFKGWYSDSAFSEGSRWNFEENVVTQPTTLYAKWEDETTGGGTTPGGDENNPGEGGNKPGGGSGSEGGSGGGSSDSGNSGGNNSGDSGNEGGSTGGSEKPNPDTGLPFTDVQTDDWFFEDVKFVYENGFMAGKDNNMFAPLEATTRAQVAVIFYRMEGSPAVEGKNSFTDVPYEPGTLWYYNAVTWAQQNNIMSGYGDNTFKPGAAITREQLAVVFYNYAAHKGYDVTAIDGLAAFTDAGNISPWAREAFVWATHIKLINGRGNGALDPQGNANRAEVAAMLRRFIEYYRLKPPAASVSGNGTTGGWTQGGTHVSSPQTGDSSGIGLWFSLFLISGSGVAISIAMLRRRREDGEAEIPVLPA